MERYYQKYPEGNRHKQGYYRKTLLTYCLILSFISVVNQNLPLYNLLFKMLVMLMVQDNIVQKGQLVT